MNYRIRVIGRWKNNGCSCCEDSWFQIYEATLQNGDIVQGCFLESVYEAIMQDVGVNVEVE